MAEVFDFGLQQHKIKMDGKFFESNLFAVAGDTGRRLEVQLLDSNNMVQNTTGISLRLNANVAGQATYAEATLVDATKGLYELDLPNGMLIAPGNWQFQWQIIGASGEKLHSFAFTGSIGSNLSEGGSEATNFYLNVEDLKQMQEDLINGTFDSVALETNIAEKLNDLEETYAPRLTEVTAQLAHIENQVNDPTIYRVGKNQKFKTIKSAYDKWLADGKPEPTIIDIFPGTYKEFINGGAGNNLTFRGRGKWNTFWISDSGYYPDAPFTGGPGGKELIFENMTVIATHDGTPNWSSTTGGAYALHIDHPNAIGKTIIRDSILVSHQDAALGSGTRKNQEIILEDVSLFSTATASVSGADGVSHGALFYHTAAESGQTGQKLTMKNVYAHSINGPGIVLLSSAAGDTEVTVEAINTIGRSDVYETYTGTTRENRVTVQNANNLLKMSENNKINNSYKLNAQGISDSLLIPFVRDLSVVGEQSLLYAANREIDSIEFKGSVDGKIGYSHSLYANGLQHLTYIEESNGKKYNIQSYVCGFSETELANRTFANIKSIANGVITLNWTKMGSGATGLANMAALVKYKKIN